MSRIEAAARLLDNAENIGVVLDVNPDLGANRRFIDENCPGEERPQARLKEYLAGRNVKYFYTSNVGSVEDLREAVEDYVANNLGADERFLLLCDRKPANAETVFGSLNDQLAEIVWRG